MMKSFLATFFTIMFCLSIYGCEDRGTVNVSESKNSTPDEQSKQTTPKSHTLGKNQGVVLDSINVDGYTYIHAENGGHQFWLAGTPIEVSKGDIIGWDQAMVMTDFNSKTLDRTFERILFVSSFTSNRDPNSRTIDKVAKVLSVISSGGYTYIEAKSGNGITQWLAVPTMSVKTNDQIAWHGGSVMSNFRSNTLDRTFERIIFTDSVEIIN